MAGENKEELKPGEKGEKGEKGEQKPKVELEQEQYEGLLDRIAELEASSVTKGKKSEEEEEEVDDLDKLAKEGKRSRKGKEVEKEEINLDEMSNSQLAQFIISTVDERGNERVNKLEVGYEFLRVSREIDKAEKDHEDFWKFEEKIKNISIKNPSLSIEDAYLLAKSKTPAKKEKEGEEEERPTTRTEKLLNLPKRYPHGEKPGQAASTTKETSQKTSLKTAAQKAWDETVGKGKVQID